jgi:hypothetical protein
LGIEWGGEDRGRAWRTLNPVVSKGNAMESLLTTTREIAQMRADPSRPGFGVFYKRQTRRPCEGVSA